MKKVLGLLVAFMLVCGIANAANTANKRIANLSFNAVTTADVSDTVTLMGYDKIAFYVVYDETEVGKSISAAVTIDVSYDGTNWLTGMAFLDIAGGATYQTTQTISADGWYVFWLTQDPCVPYLRVAVAATNTDADDLLNVKVYMVAKE